MISLFSVLTAVWREGGGREGNNVSLNKHNLSTKNHCNMFITMDLNHKKKNKFEIKF